MSALHLLLLALQTQLSDSYHCSPNPLPTRSLFYHNGEQQDVKILTSSQVESRLIASVFGIFATEVFGYDVSLVIQPTNVAESDMDSRFKQLSTCTNELCNDYNSNPLKDLVPNAMLTLDMLVPPSFYVDTWGLLDGGQLGPAVRFGWFMPNRTVNDLPLSLNHWKILRNNLRAKTFRPTQEQMAFIEPLLKTPDDRFFCTQENCLNGIFTPPECKNTENECGILIADYANNSSLVFKQILTQKLLIEVAFVGPHLSQVVSYLDSSSLTSGTSYLVLHYTPSTITLQHSLVPIMFPDCKDPLLQRDDTDTNCLYTANRLAKVVWGPVQDEAPAFYRFIQHFGFTYQEYVELLETFNTKVKSEESVDYDEVACAWLNINKYEIETNGMETAHTIYEQKVASLPLQGKPELYIGGIFPITGNKYRAPELAKVAQMAVEDVNQNSGILSSHNLVLSINDGKCEADVVMKRFIDIIKTKDTSRFRSTVGMLGPACSDTVEPIAGVSKHFRTVVISYSAEGSISTDNSKSYPYFFRTIAENKQYKHAYIATLQKLGWSKVAALTQDGAKYSDYMSTLQDEFQNNNIEFVMNRKFPKEATDMSMYVNDLKDRGAKIIIGEFYASSARLIMCEAFKSEMTQKQGYVWFLPGWFDDNWYDIDGLRKAKNKTQTEHSTDVMQSLISNGGTIQMFEDTDVGVLPSCSTSEMLLALHGHLSLVHANFAPDDNMVQANRTVSQWKNALKKKMRETRKKYKSAQRKISENNTVNDALDIDFKLDKDIQLNKYSGYVYDAVWLYAQALDTLVSKNTTTSYIQNLHSDQTVKEFVSIIKKTDFQGVTGRINFKGRPSRLSNVRIMQWLKNTSNEIFEHEIGLYVPDYEVMETSARNSTKVKMEIWNERLIRWQTLDGTKPLDNPKECGILSSFATKLDIECQLAITVVFIIGFAIILFIIFIVFLVLNRRYELKMKATEDRMRALGLLTPMSVLTLDEWEIPRDRVVINRKLGEGAFGTVYGGESFFDEKGWVAVAVKTLKLGSSIDEKIDFLSEAEMMKRFDHKNIVKLLGVCTRNEPVYTVMEFMLYGDLKTYLLARRHLVNERNREELDEVSNKRLTSMAYDVAKGLEYLAELKYIHRDIACRNCLVNSSRTVKLADFGMSRPMFENDYYRFSKKGMLPVRWMSPESLSDGLFTPMSDIWSYGVLLYEMITFGSFPFQGMSNNQVLVHIKNGHTLDIPHGIRSQMSQLLHSCWSHTPKKRPTAVEIVELLYSNPRLISPCIDVPLASVQIERTDSPELLHKQGKPAFLVSQKPRPHLNIKKIQESTSDDAGYGSGAYSPMQGTMTTNGDLASDMNDPLLEYRQGDAEEYSSTLDSSSFLGHDSSPHFPTNVSSYVPPGYIVLDHSKRSGYYSKYDADSVSSV